MSNPIAIEELLRRRKHGFDHHVVPAAPVSLKIQAYSDNFR